MKNKHKTDKYDHIHHPQPPSLRTGNPVSTTPVKAPSPDKHQPNIIQSTHSPIPAQPPATPARKEPIATSILRKIGQRQLNFDQFTLPNASLPLPHHHRQTLTPKDENTIMRNAEASLKNVEATAARSRAAIWQDEEYPEDKWTSGSELDYLRIIRQKEETIKELREILQLIDHQSRIDCKTDTDQQLKLADRKAHEYQKQIKILQIENECLISVIENNHVNIPSHKEAILQRQISQLKESLKLKEQETEDNKGNFRSVSEQLLQIQTSNHSLQLRNRELEIQCEKLVKLMQEKDSLEKHKISHLFLPNAPKGDKMTLSKIKEQYQENLKLMKLNFTAEIDKINQNCEHEMVKLNLKVDHLNKKLAQVESKSNKLQNNGRKTTAIMPKAGYHEYQQIEFLLQKYSKTERDLQKQKEVNEKLSSQLSNAQKTLRELQLRSFETSQILQISNSLRKSNELGQNQTSKEFQKELNRSVQLAEQKHINDRKAYQLKLDTLAACYQNQLRDKYNQLTELQSQIAEQKRQQKANTEQISKLQSTIRDLQNKSEPLSQQITRLKDQLAKKEQHLQHLEKQLRQSCEQKLRKAEETVRHYQQESRQAKQLADKSAKKLQIQKQKIGRLQNNYQELLEKLQRELIFKNNSCDNLQQELTQCEQKLTDHLNSTARLNTHSLEQELTLLKSMVLQHAHTLHQQSSLRQQYSSLHTQLTIKTQENLLHQKEAEALRSEISQLQKQKLLLQNKNTQLETISCLTAQQLKEKKSQYDQIANEKIRLEKQSILTTKIRLANTKHPQRDDHLIIGAIEKLLQIENCRRNELLRANI